MDISTDYFSNSLYLQLLYKYLLLIQIGCFIPSTKCYDNLALNLVSYDFFPPLYRNQLVSVTDGDTETCLITQSSTQKAYFRLDLQNIYSIKQITYKYRTLHAYRITPLKIYLSNTSNAEETLCYEWTDTTSLVPESATVTCEGVGRYVSVTAERGSSIVGTNWRTDDPTSAMSFCDIIIPGCKTHGTFGVSCAQTCNCKTFTCDYVTGVCPNNECADGWEGATCSNATDVITTSPTKTPIVMTSTKQASSPKPRSTPSITSTKTSTFPAGFNITSFTSTQTSTQRAITAQPSAFIDIQDGVGAGAIAAVAMVAMSLIIVVGLVILVGLSFKKQHQYRGTHRSV